MQESGKEDFCTWKSMQIFKPRTSQVSYESIYKFPICMFVWMFCSRNSNNRINHMNERALRIVYNDHSSTFEDLLVKTQFQFITGTFVC